MNYDAISILGEKYHTLSYLTDFFTRSVKKITLRNMVVKVSSASFLHHELSKQAHLM